MLTRLAGLRANLLVKRSRAAGDRATRAVGEPAQVAADPGVPTVLDHPPSRSATDERMTWVDDVSRSLRAHPEAWVRAAVGGELQDDRPWTLLSWVEDVASTVVPQKRLALVEDAGFALTLLEADEVPTDLRDAWVVAELLRYACDLAEVGYASLVTTGARRAGAPGEQASSRLRDRRAALPATFFDEVWDDGPFVFRRRSAGPGRWVGWEHDPRPWPEGDLSGVKEAVPSVGGSARFAGLAAVAAAAGVALVVWVGGPVAPLAVFLLAPAVLAVALLVRAIRLHLVSTALVRRLGALRRELRAEAGAGTPTAPEAELRQADALVGEARALLADRRPAAAAEVVAHLARWVEQSWSREAASTRQVAALGRRARTITRVNRRTLQAVAVLASRSGPEDPADVAWWDRWLVRTVGVCGLIWVAAIALVTADDGVFRSAPAWAGWTFALVVGLGSTATVVAWQLRRQRRGRGATSR